MGGADLCTARRPRHPSQLCGGKLSGEELAWASAALKADADQPRLTPKITRHLQTCLTPL